jgi:hypothetical protein|tara:strand:+ start:2765 stop:4288 length:1524 start_codon:yes stop_codon:yes gene_type:complete
MAINKTSTKYFENGSISFSELASTFGGTEPDGSIKFSTYKRDTESDEPLIPDAVENSDISTDDNLSVEAFRDTITEIVVTQTGTDEEVEFQSYFGANIAKNIRKRLEIDGTIFSDENNKYAAQITTTENIRNLDVDIDGNIYGAGGPVNGDGGGSLFIQSAGTNRKFNLNIKSGGKLWAGGGGGTGGTGNPAKSGTCNQSYSYQRSEQYSVTNQHSVRQSYSRPPATKRANKQQVTPRNPITVPQPRTEWYQQGYHTPGNPYSNSHGDANDRTLNRTKPQRQARERADAECAPYQGVQNFTVLNSSDRRKCRRRGGMRGRKRGQQCGNKWGWRCLYIRSGVNPPEFKYRPASVVVNNYTTQQPRPPIVNNYRQSYQQPRNPGRSTVQQPRTQYYTRNQPVSGTNSNTINVSGGNPGSGGHGEGYFSGGIRAAQAGNSGQPGPNKSCPSGFSGASISGGAGNAGNKGGGWGQKGDGGKAGAFISYNGNIRITGKSTNTAKGREETRDG